MSLLNNAWVIVCALGAGILSVVLAFMKGKKSGRVEAESKAKDAYIEEVAEHEKAENRWSGATRDELIDGLRDTPSKPSLPKPKTR
jgi:hypothetical protein